VKPFLLLASLAEDAAAEEDYQAYLRFGGLAPDQLKRIRMEAAPLPVNLARIRPLPRTLH
jgi:GMP synthase (glutamine-hydrolysing)